jgi:hypothetical protein
VFIPGQACGNLYVKTAPMNGNLVMARAVLRNVRHARITISIEQHKKPFDLITVDEGG